MNWSVRFEPEADEEFRAAAGWYESQRQGLGADFLDSVDNALTQIVQFPRAGARVPRLPADLPVRTGAAVPVSRRLS